MPRLDRGIQYAAASRPNRCRLWNTGSPAFAGDDRGECRRLPVSPQLALVRRVVRLIDRELVHRGRPQMLGKAWRCEIDLAARNTLGECAVELGHRALHAEQPAQPPYLRSIAPLFPRQLPRHEIENVDCDAQLEGLVAGDQRRDVVTEEIGD